MLTDRYPTNDATTLVHPNGHTLNSHALNGQAPNGRTPRARAVAPPRISNLKSEIHDSPPAPPTPALNPDPLSPDPLSPEPCPPEPSKTLSEKDAALFDDYCFGPGDLRCLLFEHSLRLLDLLAWRKRPDIRARIDAVRAMQRERAELIHEEARLYAARVLQNLLLGTEDPIELRRIAIPLLRSRLRAAPTPPPGKPSAAPAPAAPPEPPAPTHSPPSRAGGSAERGEAAGAPPPARSPANTCACANTPRPGSPAADSLSRSAPPPGDAALAAARSPRPAACARRQAASRASPLPSPQPTSPPAAPHTSVDPPDMQAARARDDRAARGRDRHKRPGTQARLATHSSLGGGPGP